MDNIEIIYNIDGGQCPPYKTSLLFNVNPDSKKHSKFKFRIS
jgi:hypothetical protein